jgi:hypothetical protein
MGTPQRIQSVADIVLGDSSERKLVIVSAMSKVTDMMYNLVHKAQSRDDSYTIALEQVYEKHMASAKDILDGEDLARFLSQLHSDVSNLRAMLRAIYIGLRCYSPLLMYMYFWVMKLIFQVWKYILILLNPFLFNFAVLESPLYCLKRKSHSLPRH